MSGGDNHREQLRRLLRDRAILYANPAQPIHHRNGNLAPWAFYSWNVSTTSEGLGLIAVNLLDRLRSFRSTQLAAYGYTGIPILTACVQASAGAYSSVVIREQRKAYLSGRQIEGVLDKSRPVVVIDDSLSSGTSLQSAIVALEEEGVEVEGAIALVNFPHRGGLEWANLSGYRTECLFDIWSDLEMEKTSNFRLELNNNHLAFGDDVLKDGCHPAVIARQTADYYLRYGRLPRPPRYLDGNYDGRGGVFVSFRERDTGFRLAREGFWHFDPAQFDAGRDVVLATAETLEVAQHAITLERLPQMKIAVTFFTPLEEIRPSHLDFDRYGIVVVSRIPPYRRGGALPNTQVFISETEQYQQARFINAKLATYEPHRLYRHRIQKCVEPGEGWLPYGCEEENDTNWWRNEELGKRLTERARKLVMSHLYGQTLPEDPLPDDLAPAKVMGVGINLYHRGLVACGMAQGGSLESTLQEAAAKASRDRGFAHKVTELNLEEIAITVSVLHHPEWLVSSPLPQVARKIRRGLDSLSVQDECRSVTFPPSLIPYNNWSREQYVDALLAFSGVDRETCAWTTYQTATWVSHAGGVLPVRFGFPHREAKAYDAAGCAGDIYLLGSYIERTLQDDNLPAYYISPVVGEVERYGSAARVIHGLMALGLAGRVLEIPRWQMAAQCGLQYCMGHLEGGTLCLPHHSAGPLSECILLAAISLIGEDLAHTASAASLATRVAGLFHPDGRISDGPKFLALPHDHDYLPGAALWALAEYSQTSGSGSLPAFIQEQLAWYQRRFQVAPTWGAAGWQPQGWRSAYRLTQNPAQRDFVFAAADWAVDQQLEKNGAFLEDLSTDEPSFNTGFIAEGIAAAWSLALRCDDHERAARYQLSWMQAMQFMSKLIVYPEDLFCMREPDLALGGVRTMQSRSDIRIDQVSHCLHALCDGLLNLKQSERVLELQY